MEGRISAAVWGLFDETIVAGHANGDMSIIDIRVRKINYRVITKNPAKFIFILCRRRISGKEGIVCIWEKLPTFRRAKTEFCWLLRQRIQRLR